MTDEATLIDQRLEELSAPEHHTSSLRLSQALDEVVCDEAPPRDPDEAIKWMNAKHFVVREAGKTVVITEQDDPALGRSVRTRSSFQDIRNYYSNHGVAVHGPGAKDVALGTFWLNHPKRRSYEGIVCDPTGKTSRFYNLWRGFAVAPKRGDWSLMDEHIRENICAKDEELYRYVRGWLAFAVQKPATLPEVALVMRGKQGTGKGVFAKGFGTLFGQHFLQLDRSHQLVGNFNAHLQDALVVFLDEAFMSDDKEAANILKFLITEDELNIERKHQDMIRARNMTHLIVASNNDQIITAAAEERRFCFLDVGESRMQDHEFFRRLTEQMTNGGQAAMLYDLQKEDVSAFNVRRVPQTAGLADQKLRSLSPAEKWWFARIQQGRLLEAVEGWPYQIHRDVLLSDYRDATLNRRHTAQNLQSVLARLLPHGYPLEGPRETVRGVRMRSWLLPPLETCRKHFAEMFRLPIEWDEDSDQPL